MTRKTIFFFIIFIVPLSIFALSTKELAVSINLAGKQRMLTQKMTKEALLVKEKINIKENLKKLQKTRDLFNKTLEGLLHSDKSLNLKACTNKKVQQQLNKVAQIWHEFDENIQKVIHNTADKNVYKAIQVQNLTLLKEMNEAVTLYVNQSKQKTSKRAQAINLSGKERMLTQKMAKDLLLVSQGIDVEKNKHDLQSTANLFEKILQGLQHGDASLGLDGTKLPGIKRQLQVGEKLWQEIRPGFSKAFHDKKIRKEMIVKLDLLLVEMNKAVKKFEKSIQREKQALQLSSLVNQFMQSKNRENHVVNLSGKQRMLTQKMTKLALLVSLGIDKRENKIDLKKAYMLYDKTLNGFVTGDQLLDLPVNKNPKISAYIKVLQKEWQPFAQKIQKIIQSDKKESQALAYVVSHNEALLQKSNHLVQLFKKVGPHKSFIEKARLNIVDIAGRQRMLTQKMTKEKLLILAKVHVSQNRKKLQESVTLFDNSLQALIYGDKTLKIPKPANQKIKKQLMRVQNLWQTLKPLYLADRISTKELDKIINENPLLLAKMNKAVHLSEVVVDY